MDEARPAHTAPPIQWKPVVWPNWSHRVSVRLWEAVALSLNIDPDYLLADVRGGEEPKRFSGESLRRASLREYLPQEFLDRLVKASEALICGTLKYTNMDEAPDRQWNSTVMVVEFTRFCGIYSWDIPEDMKARLVRNPNTELGGEDEIHTKERNSYLLIIAGLTKLSQLDLTHPSAAAESVVSAVKQLGARISARNVAEKLKEAAEVARGTAQT